MPSVKANNCKVTFEESAACLRLLGPMCDRDKFMFCDLPQGVLSLRKEEPLPELFPQTPVSSYYWPRRTQVADKVVSPSCFGLPCRLVHSRGGHSVSPSAIGESYNVSRPSMYSLLDNVYDVIYTCLMSYPGITFVVT